MPVEYRRPDALGEVQEKMKEPALRPAGILHADHDLGQDALENPRRRKEIGRPELAQIEHDRRLRFRAGGAKAGAIGLRIGEDVLADPRHRQIGQHLLALGQAFERDRVLRRDDDVVEAEDDALGLPRRPRGVEDDRGVAAPPFGDFTAEKPRLLAGEFAAALLHLRVIVEPGLAVMPHAARIGEDHLFEQRAALLDLGQFVDLLLVFGHRETHLGMVEHKGHLFGDRILVDRHRHAAQRLRRGDRPIEPRPVVADDRELVAAPEADGRETAGERLDLGGDLGPAPALPDPVILLAVGRPLRPHPRMLEQQFRKRIRPRRIEPRRGRSIAHRR